MQRKCHSCSTLFEVHGNDVLCDDCKNPATRKSFKQPKNVLTWRQKFDMEWEQYDKEHQHDSIDSKHVSKTTHCCVCGNQLPPTKERRYGRLCSNKCKRRYNEN